MLALRAGRFFALASLIASSASAEGPAILQEPAAAGNRGLMVSDAEIQGHLRLHGSLAAAAVHEPLVVVTPAQQRDRVISDQLALHAGLALTVAHRWLLGVALPAVLARAWDAGPSDRSLSRPSGGFELGDARLIGRVRVLGPADDGVRASLGAELWLPTGAADSYSGDGIVRAGGWAIVGGTHGRFAWSLEGGGRSRRAVILSGAVPYRVGAQLVFGGAATFALDNAARSHAGVELRTESSVSNGALLLDARSTNGVGLAALHWRVSGSALVLSGGFGPGFGQAPGAGTWHALARVTWSPPADPPPPDHDDDGVPDATDACIKLFGYPSGDPLMNGCPELPKDLDADSIPDENDACPKKPGIPTNVRATHGCPRPKDRDRDGIHDRADACPDEPGVASSDPTRHGCTPPPPPPPPVAELVEKQIVISEQIQFETGTAELRPISDGVLQHVKDVLMAHLEITQLEVQGHTDDTGTPELNQRLSRERAEAVVRWLAAQGVDRNRLAPRGYGNERPLAPNDTEEGRAKNRRVEFHVVDEGGSGP